jgi:hypothetical protein
MPVLVSVPYKNCFSRSTRISDTIALAIYFQEVGDTSTSGSIRDSASTAFLFLLCSMTMRQGGHNQLFPSVYIKMG